MKFLDFGYDPVPAIATFAAIAFIILIYRSNIRIFIWNKERYHVVAGTVLGLFLNFPRLHDYLTDFSTKHRTFRLLGFYRSDVYTADPVIIEYILKTNFANYGKGWYNYEKLTDLLGDGIFTVDGEKWKHQRKVASYEINTKAVRDFSLQVFKFNAVKLAGVVSKTTMSSTPVDFQELFMKSTLDSVFKVVLGVELDTMCGTYEEGIEFSHAFDEASALTLFRYADVSWKIKRFLNIGSEAKLRNLIKVVDDFVYKLIRIKIEQAETSQDETKEDMVSRFLALNETDAKYLRDIILSFVIAGRDTTASTLSWFFYLLCKHPHVQEKIVHEIGEATKLKNTCSIDELADSLTDEALENMHYLHAALSETLRLYPAVPVDGKLCLSDETLPDGFSIRKDESISYLPYAMGRMKFIWGDDAEEFRPERWLDESGTFQQKSSFKFIAFQAGPRICLGKDFSYRQMKIFAAVLCHSYKFKLANQFESVNYKTMLTLHVDGGLHLHASHRFEPMC